MTKPGITYYKAGVAYIAWWLLWIVIQSYVLHQVGFGWGDAAIDATLSQLVLAIAGYTINTSMHAYHPSPRNSLYVLIWSIALAALCVTIQRWTITQLIEGASFSNQSMLIRGLFAWLMIIIIALLTWFWFYMREQQENDKRRDDTMRLAREAELSNLRMQLQPHFLFNSLNSISALTGSQPDLARKMIQQLSDFLRGTLKKDERQLVTLEQEFQHLQLYLDIEKVRFGHRLKTVIDYKQQCLQMMLPSLILQPLVENAIKFGLYDTVGEITIAINAKVEGGQLMLEIRNPFDPETSQPRRGTGFGLNSVHRRLYLIYSQNDLLVTRAEENIFITTITVPQ